MALRVATPSGVRCERSMRLRSIHRRSWVRPTARRSIRSSSKSCSSVLLLATRVSGGDEGKARVRQHVLDEGIALFPKLSELRCAQFDQVDITADIAPDPADPATKLVAGRRPDDQEIDIAPRTIGARGVGAEDEGLVDARKIGEDLPKACLHSEGPLDLHPPPEC